MTKEYAIISNGDFAERTKNGRCVEYFEELLQQNEKLISSVAMAFRNTKEELEDLVSIARITFWNAYTFFDPHNEAGANFLTYATNAMRTELVKLYNRKNTAKRTADISSLDIEIKSNGDSLGSIMDMIEDESASRMFEIFEESDFVRFVTTEFYRINKSDTHKKVYEHYFLYGTDSEEAAQTIGIEPNNYRSVVYNVKGKLRKHVQPLVLQTAM